MKTSEVRIKLIQDPTDRLKAFCSITLDGDFVIRDIKIIEGGAGIFIAMPSRKLTDHCPGCRAKNHLRASYCNECGAELAKERVQRDRSGRRKLHADIAHPINSPCRQSLQDSIIEAYEQELAASRQPGYQPTQLGDEEYEFDDGEPTASAAAHRATVDRDRPEHVDADADHDVDADVDHNVDAGEDDDYRNMIDDLKRDASDRRDHRRRADGLDADEQDQLEETDAAPHHTGKPDRLSTAVVTSNFGAGLNDQRDPDSGPARPAAAPTHAANADAPDDSDDFGVGIT